MSDPLLSSTVVQHRRELIAKTFADHKQKKLKRKLPVDMQMLDCAQEDLKLKKKNHKRMELSDQQYTETIGKLSKNMDKLTNSIVDRFAVLKNALYCPPPSSPSGAAYRPPAYAPPPGPSHAASMFPFTSRSQEASNFDFQDPVNHVVHVDNHDIDSLQSTLL